MKAILEFDLNEPFERNAHIRAVKSTDAYLALYQMRSFLFKVVDGQELSEMPESLAENLLKEYDDILSCYGIDLEGELE